MVGAYFSLLLARALQGDFLTLSIDAREAMYGLYHVHETIPARPGKLVLSYPKWIPGDHMPTGPLNNVINLYFRAGAKTLTWQRDDVEFYHFIVDVPAGVNSIDVDFDNAEAVSWGKNYTPNLARLAWDHMILYPAGEGSDYIRVTSSVTVPTGWRLATPLLKEPASTDRIDFPTVSLTEYIDSPGVTGKYFNRILIGDQEELDLFGENAGCIKMTDDQIAKCKNLVNEEAALFGAHHYRKYDFLVTLSDAGAEDGLEHHECSEDGQGTDTFQPNNYWKFGDLICHEYTHSWNGKYRRPAGLITLDYDGPMRDELLWVYEGMTQYLGIILEARTGFVTPAEEHDFLAVIAAEETYVAGRNWRTLEDTATTNPVLRPADNRWTSMRRNIDYYDEAVLTWLEVDSIIRQQTSGQKSLDDFNKLFQGGTTGGPEVRPYSFDDVVQALNIIAPYDWATFLRTRTETIQPQLSLAGLTNDGWNLVYNDTPNTVGDWRVAKNNAKFTVGAQIESDGTVTDVILTMPAGVAGLRPGMKVVAVNNKKFSDDVFNDALSARSDMDLLVEYGGQMTTLHVVYHDGLRYPHLVRDATKPDLLSDVLKPHAPAPAPSGT